MKKACLKCFQEIAVPSRFKIFEYLKHQGKAKVNELVGLLGLKQPTVTFHLGVLETVGLISKTQVGREVFCQAKKPCKNCPLFT